MNLILKNGICSKNSPINTIDSMMLTLKRKDISGVNITVQMTSDGILVVYTNNRIFNHEINEITYKELIRFNIGTRIRKNRVLTLKEVLELFNGSFKKIVISLPDYKDKNQKLVEALLDVTNNYPNIDIYIKSFIKEDILYLRDIVNNCRLGAIVNDNDSYFWNLNLDFYSIGCSNVDYDLILKQLKNDNTIMFEDFKDRDIEMINRISNYSDNIYVIMDSVNQFVTSLH